MLEMITNNWFTSIILFFVGLFLLSGIRIVYEFQRGNVFTFGKFSGVAQPGFRWVFPIVQTMDKVDIRQTVVDLPKQDVMTKDQVSLKVDGVLFYTITKPSATVLNVNGLHRQLREKASSELKESIATMNLSDVLSKRTQIAESIKQELDKAVSDSEVEESKRKEWGVTIRGLQVNNIHLPDTLERAMAKEAEAERERKAIKIRAEGEKEAAETYRDAAEIYSENPIAIKLREFKVYEEIGKESETMVMVIPKEQTVAITPPIKSRVEIVNQKKKKENGEK